jgi:cellobiose transport system substrate-binding protein
MRFLRVFLIVVCVFALFGCGTTDTSTKQGKTKITLWYWNRSLSDDLLKKVSKKFPNIQLEPQKIGGDFRLKLQTTLVGGSGAPDIVLFNDWVSQYLTYSDEFANLYDYGAKDIQKDYLSWKWNLAVPPNKKNDLLALPIDTGPTALYYRTDLFQKAGLPTDPAKVGVMLHSWDSYMTAGEQLKQKTGDFMVDNIENVFTQVLGQNENKFFDKNDNYIGDGPTVKKAWDTAIEFNKRGLSAKIDGWTTDWNASMNNGKVATFVGAVWMKDVLKDAAPDTKGKWHVASPPDGAGNNGGSFIGIMASSPHKKEAYEVIKWLMSPDNQLKNYLDVDLYPSAIDTLNNEKMNRAEPFFGNQNTNTVFKNSAQKVPNTYFGEDYTTIANIFLNQLKLVEREGKDPNQAWKDAQAKAKRELSRR